MNANIKLIAFYFNAQQILLQRSKSEYWMEGVWV